MHIFHSFNIRSWYWRFQVFTLSCLAFDGSWCRRLVFKLSIDTLKAFATGYSATSMPFALDDCGTAAGHWCSDCSCQCYSLFVKPACSSCNTASATFQGTMDSMSHSPSPVGLHYSHGFTSVVSQIHMALSLLSLLFNIQPLLQKSKVAASSPASTVEYVSYFIATTVAFWCFCHALPYLIHMDCQRKLDASQYLPGCPSVKLGVENLFVIYASQDHTELHMRTQSAKNIVWKRRLRIGLCSPRSQLIHSAGSEKIILSPSHHGNPFISRNRCLEESGISIYSAKKTLGILFLFCFSCKESAYCFLYFPYCSFLLPYHLIFLNRHHFYNFC